MAGSLTIPNQIGSQPGPTIQSSLFDDNWDAIADYVNAREVEFDIIADRPAAGVSGRYFYATDQQTFYLDNGTSWLTVAGGGPGGATASLPGFANLNGLYNSGDTDEFALTADRVYVSALAGTSGHYLSAVAVTIDLTVVGANGRDQAAALTASTWAYLYVIYNPTTATVAGLVSASAWPTSSPTLPSGYTELALAGAVFIDGSVKFSAQAINGRWTTWLSPNQVLTNGAASTETSISLTTAIPPNAQRVQGYATMRNTVAATGPEYVFGEVSMPVAGGTALPLVRLNYAIDTTYAAATGASFIGYAVSQALKYKIVDDGGAAADGTNQMQVFITGYENPSGA